MDVREFYQLTLSERGFTVDAAQARAVERLQQAYEEWAEFRVHQASPVRRLFQRPVVPKGVYLWGGVGRGKSFLMDGFYGLVPIRRKTRVHFHEFMRMVHAELDRLKGMSDPLDAVARNIAEQYRLICFDEFHISDIADAMILHNLLRELFDHGVSFVMTSNYAPDALYPDGLHRDRMLPAIALLKEHMDVLHLDGPSDYRQLALEQVDAYHVPADAAADTALEAAFERIAEAADEQAVLQIQSRTIGCRRRAGGVIWFDFATLCGGPRSQNDYLEIASRFHTVLLSGVPQMTPAMSSPARRFVWLVDVLYDRKTKLLLSADVLPDLLYPEGILANEFLRTASRLREMQTRQYMEASRMPGLQATG